MTGTETMFVEVILGGTALVPFVDLFKSASSKLKYTLAIVTSLILGGIVVYLQHQVIITNDPGTWFTVAGAVFVTSQTIFNLYWKESLLRQKVFSLDEVPVESKPMAEVGSPAESSPQE